MLQCLKQSSCNSTISRSSSKGQGQQQHQQQQQQGLKEVLQVLSKAALAGIHCFILALHHLQDGVAELPSRLFYLQVGRIKRAAGAQAAEGLEELDLEEALAKPSSNSRSSSSSGKQEALGVDKASFSAGGPQQRLKKQDVLGKGDGSWFDKYKSVSQLLEKLESVPNPPPGIHTFIGSIRRAEAAIGSLRCGEAARGLFVGGDVIELQIWQQLARHKTQQLLPKMESWEENLRQQQQQQQQSAGQRGGARKGKGKAGAAVGGRVGVDGGLLELLHQVTTQLSANLNRCKERGIQQLEEQHKVWRGWWIAEAQRVVPELFQQALGSSDLESDFIAAFRRKQGGAGELWRKAFVLLSAIQFLWNLQDLHVLGLLLASLWRIPEGGVLGGAVLLQYTQKIVIYALYMERIGSRPQFCSEGGVISSSHSQVNLEQIAKWRTERFTRCFAAYGTVYKRLNLEGVVAEWAQHGGGPSREQVLQTLFQDRDEIFCDADLDSASAVGGWAAAQGAPSYDKLLELCRLWQVREPDMQQVTAAGGRAGSGKGGWDPRKDKEFQELVRAFECEFKQELQFIVSAIVNNQDQLELLRAGGRAAVEKEDQQALIQAMTMTYGAAEAIATGAGRGQGWRLQRHILPLGLSLGGQAFREKVLAAVQRGQLSPGEYQFMEGMLKGTGKETGVETWDRSSRISKAGLRATSSSSGPHDSSKGASSSRSSSKLTAAAQQQGKGPGASKASEGLKKGFFGREKQGKGEAAAAASIGDGNLGLSSGKGEGLRELSAQEQQQQDDGRGWKQERKENTPGLAGNGSSSRSRSSGSSWYGEYRSLASHFGRFSASPGVGPLPEDVAEAMKGVGEAEAAVTKAAREVPVENVKLQMHQQLVLVQAKRLIVALYQWGQDEEEQHVKAGEGGSWAAREKQVEELKGFVMGVYLQCDRAGAREQLAERRGAYRVWWEAQALEVLPRLLQQEKNRGPAQAVVDASNSPVAGLEPMGVADRKLAMLLDLLPVLGHDFKQQQPQEQGPLLAPLLLTMLYLRQRGPVAAAAYLLVHEHEIQGLLRTAGVILNARAEAGDLGPHGAVSGMDMGTTAAAAATAAAVESPQWLVDQLEDLDQRFMRFSVLGHAAEVIKQRLDLEEVQSTQGQQQGKSKLLEKCREWMRDAQAAQTLPENDIAMRLMQRWERAEGAADVEGGCSGNKAGVPLPVTAAVDVGRPRDAASKDEGVWWQPLADQEFKKGWQGLVWEVQLEVREIVSKLLALFPFVDQLMPPSSSSSSGGSSSRQAVVSHHLDEEKGKLPVWSGGGGMEGGGAAKQQLLGLNESPASEGGGARRSGAGVARQRRGGSGEELLRLGVKVGQVVTYEWVQSLWEQGEPQEDPRQRTLAVAAWVVGMDDGEFKKQAAECLDKVIAAGMPASDPAADCLRLLAQHGKHALTCDVPGYEELVIYHHNNKAQLEHAGLDKVSVAAEAVHLLGPSYFDPEHVSVSEEEHPVAVLVQELMGEILTEEEMREVERELVRKREELTAATRGGSSSNRRSSSSTGGGLQQQEGYVRGFAPSAEATDVLGSSSSRGAAAGGMGGLWTSGSAEAASSYAGEPSSSSKQPGYVRGFQEDGGAVETVVELLQQQQPSSRPQPAAVLRPFPIKESVLTGTSSGSNGARAATEADVGCLQRAQDFAVWMVRSAAYILAKKVKSASRGDGTAEEVKDVAAVAREVQGKALSLKILGEEDKALVLLGEIAALGDRGSATWLLLQKCDYKTQRQWLDKMTAVEQQLRREKGGAWGLDVPPTELDWWVKAYNDSEYCLSRGMSVADQQLWGDIGDLIRTIKEVDFKQLFTGAAGLAGDGGPSTGAALSSKRSELPRLTVPEAAAAVRPLPGLRSSSSSKSTAVPTAAAAVAPLAGRGQVWLPSSSSTATGAPAAAGTSSYPTLQDWQDGYLGLKSSMKNLGRNARIYQLEQLLLSAPAVGADVDDDKMRHLQRLLQQEQVSRISGAIEELDREFGQPPSYEEVMASQLPPRPRSISGSSTTFGGRSDGAVGSSSSRGLLAGDDDILRMKGGAGYSDVSSDEEGMQQQQQPGRRREWSHPQQLEQQLEQQGLEGGFLDMVNGDEGLLGYYDNVDRLASPTAAAARSRLPGRPDCEEYMHLGSSSDDVAVAESKRLLGNIMDTNPGRHTRYGGTVNGGSSVLDDSLEWIYDDSTPLLQMAKERLDEKMRLERRRSRQQQQEKVGKGGVEIVRRAARESGAVTATAAVASVLLGIWEAAQHVLEASQRMEECQQELHTYMKNFADHQQELMSIAEQLRDEGEGRLTQKQKTKLAEKGQEYKGISAFYKEKADEKMHELAEDRQALAMCLHKLAYQRQSLRESLGGKWAEQRPQMHFMSSWHSGYENDDSFGYGYEGGLGEATKWLETGDEGRSRSRISGRSSSSSSRRLQEEPAVVWDEEGRGCLQGVGIRCSVVRGPLEAAIPDVLLKGIAARSDDDLPSELMVSLFEDWDVERDNWSSEMEEIFNVGDLTALAADDIGLAKKQMEASELAMLQLLLRTGLLQETWALAHPAESGSTASSSDSSSSSSWGSGAGDDPDIWPGPSAEAAAVAAAAAAAAAAGDKGKGGAVAASATAGLRRPVPAGLKGLLQETWKVPIKQRGRVSVLAVVACAET